VLLLCGGTYRSLEAERSLYAEVLGEDSSTVFNDWLKCLVHPLASMGVFSMEISKARP